MIIRNPSAFIDLAHKWNKDNWNDLVPSINIFMFIEDDNALGSISLVECDLINFCYLTPWIANLYVLPEFRGKGIGKRLMQYCMSLNKESFCYTEDQNLVKVYSSWGWKAIVKTENKTILHYTRPI